MVLLWFPMFSWQNPIVSWQNLIENPMTWRKNSMPGADEGNFLPAIAGV